MHSKGLAKFLRKVYKRYGDLMSLYLSYYYVNWCKSILRKNKLPIKKVPCENEYLSKWKVLSSIVNRDYLVIFSNYIDPSPNIVPEDICHNIIEHVLNPVKYRPYYSDKNFFEKILPIEFFPTTFLRNIDGEFLDSDYNFINVKTIDDLRFYLRNNDYIIIKPTVNSSSGNNIDLFYKKGSCDYVHIVSGEKLSLDYLKIKYNKNYIFQEKLIQHDHFSMFNYSSVNTLRLLTYRSVATNEVFVTSSIMRIGGDGSYVDNAHAGGVFIGVDSNGLLSSFAVDQYGKKYTNFNNIDFENQKYKIPYFQNAVALAKEVGSRILHHRILALDIVITADGSAKLIEFNIDSLSTWLFQFTIGPAFSDCTDEIIDYCKIHKNKIEKVRVSVW